MGIWQQQQDHVTDKGQYHWSFDHCLLSDLETFLETVCQQLFLQLFTWAVVSKVCSKEGSKDEPLENVLN